VCALIVQFLPARSVVAPLPSAPPLSLLELAVAFLPKLVHASRNGCSNITPHGFHHARPNTEVRPDREHGYLGPTGSGALAKWHQPLLSIRPPLCRLQWSIGCVMLVAIGFHWWVEPEGVGNSFFSQSDNNRWTMAPTTPTKMLRAGYLSMWYPAPPIRWWVKSYGNKLCFLSVNRFYRTYWTNAFDVLSLTAQCSRWRPSRRRALCSVNSATPSERTPRFC